jgi:energy-coupling factor transport system ATP-binding protein
MERVEDDVAFGLENRGWPRERMRARVPEALALVGLEGFERRRSTRLSGGERQRLALAGVLAPSPALLVLDEPTADLDPAGAATLFRILAELRARRAVTIVLVEHRVELCWPLADRVLALGPAGRVLDTGRPDEVLARSGTALARAGIWLPDGIEDVPTKPATAPPPPPSRVEDVSQLVQVEHLGFAYEPGRLAVHDADLRIDPGERVALVGANGSGKSTLGRLLVGLLRPTSGHVGLEGVAPDRLPARDLARRAGFAFQEPERQFLRVRVGEDVRVGLTAAEEAGVEALMAQLDLPLGRFAERSPYTLSGGEQRRLSLACLLVRRPALLVLDEPTFGLDRHGYEGLLAILRERVSAGTAVVAATHDLRLVRDLCPRSVALSAGAVDYDGPTRALFTDEARMARLGLAPS